MFVLQARILLDEEQTSLFGLANNVEWTDAVKSYYDAPRKIIGFLSQQIGVPANQIIQKLHQPAAALPFIVEKEDSVSDAPLSGSDQDAALEKAPPSAGDQDAALEKAPPSASDQDAALEKAPPSASDQDAALENGLISRRKFVIQRIVPAVQKIANTNLVMKLLENCFPGLSGDVIKCLLEVDQASISDNKNILLTPTLLDAAKKMKSDERIENAFFFPPIADGYYFIAPDDKCKKMAVDKHILTFSLSDLQHLTSTVPLNPDRIYQLELAGEEKSLTSVRFSSSQAEPQLFTPETLCPEPLASNICQAFNGLERSLLAVKLFQIDLSEVRYFQSQGMIFSKLTVSDVFKLHEFTLYRRECSNTETSAPVRYLRYLDSIPMDAGVELRKQLVAETASLTKLTISQVEDYLLSKWPTCSVKTIANILRTPREIINMLFATRMADTLGLRMVNLFEWCMLPSIPTWEEDHQLARSLKMPLSSSSSLPTAAHANQQRALQAYLLEMPFFRDQEINTPDGLFKYFLIDVQMGSELQTTRIGQAIATVQLFVQRCLLGLEKKNGIQTNVINSSKWDWMGRFTLWQANRKVFLYPENWTDPTLRDNQTEAFKVLQGKVLQNSLNLESINQMIREYIYSVNEIADLEIQSYLWEGTSGSFRGKYHIFARTRTAPYIFYYRWLEVIGVFGAQLEWYWFPWMKMDVDIPSYEVDGDNSTLPKPGTYLMPALLKDRLYLFIPQIIKKTLPSPTTDVKFGDLPGTKLDALSAQDYWEIKMGWTELRNGKWSAKQTTQTGIEVKRPKPTSESDSQPGSTANPEPKWVLPSVSSFRFRLQSRSSTSTPGSNSTPILMIHTEWLKLDSVEKRDKQTHAEIVYIGSFEMQGVRLRVSTTSIPPEKTPSLQWLTTFSRFSHHSSCENASLLVAEVESTVQVPYTKSLTIDNNLGKDEQIPIDKFVKVETSPPMPLLAVPDPKPVAGEVAGYDLSWLMAFDDTQNAAGTGLVVERYTASAVESFFGFPAPKIDATAFDTQAKTTVLTTSLSYGTAPLLMEKATSTDDLESIFGTLENIPKNMIHLAFGQDGELFRELTSPSSIYTWELGFHVILLLVERLLATQQFDLAIQLSRQVFDPTRNDKFLSKGQDIVKSNTENEPMSRLDYCWRFHPFKSHAVRTKGSTRDIVKCLDANSTPNDITLWEANPFSAHSVARQRPVIYMKRFVIKCIEILLASGDHHFRQNSLEAIPLALQRYVEASELFGPAPQAIDSPTEKSTRTYAQIKDFVDAFANSRVDMELLFPYFINSQKQSGSQKYRHGTLGFVNSTYFSVPTNPEVQALREAIDDRFFKIRHGLDIYGNPRRLPLFDPPVDVGQLVAHAANGGGTGFGALLEAIDGPMPNYRSMYLLQKALELCGELKVFADSFLIIKEKQDAEELSSLRARQDVGMQSLLTEIKRMQLKESLSTLQSLSETRKSHVTRLQFYLRLIGEPPRASTKSYPGMGRYPAGY
ncbi:uncharacterized protein N7483_002011 [Penicillium malachiteum]|uniref:uncharacterized protein n=1 Tax=Penicillium malachiteum TaxID=1324776 RepID=UPI0025498EB7|nr:uncharacterized protein N7483_002011 [Penicillium malachiteum]KAJ5736886.1 hypothetical protein N7483_002011 [Penicillium malachiteum]